MGIYKDSLIFTHECRVELWMDHSICFLGGWGALSRSVAWKQGPGAEVLHLNWERSDSSHILIFDLSYVIVL